MRHALCLGLQTALLTLIITQPATARSISVMQYNVENLFDPYHDPSKQDTDFTPEGKEHWTMESLDWKSRNLAQIITSINNPDGSICPDILVLEEVENTWVTKRFKDGPLQPCQYKKIVIDAKSPDVRGIRVAMMSRLDLSGAPLSHFVYAGGRTIQESTFEVDGHRLTVFGNHWKSRIARPPHDDGGESSRIAAAAIVRKRVEALLQESPNADIVVAGDLNDEPENNSLYKTLGVSGGFKATDPDAPPALFWEPSAELIQKFAAQFEELEDSQRDFMFRKARGTYYYRKQFFQLDHLLLSQGLFDSENFSYQRNSFQVVRVPAFVDPKTQGALSFKNMFDEDGNDRGPKGASDHFPILIRLNYE